MADEPFTPRMREWLIALFDSFCQHTGRLPENVSVRVCGGDKAFYRALKDDGRDFTTRSFDRSVGGFSDAWPEDLAWPAGVPRWGSLKVPDKPRFNKAKRGEAAAEAA